MSVLTAVLCVVRQEHEGKPFYEKLCEFMSSGPIYAMVLEKVAAIRSWRTLLGPTNIEDAQKECPLSIRARFATSTTENAGHGSDSIKSVQREVQFFFPEIPSGLTMPKGVVQEYMDQLLPNGGVFGLEHSKVCDKMRSTYRKIARIFG